ncbi:MAG: hydantoinase/oxoprolinase family protein [Anaerolineae bacterium]|nr:hydantoinase/oxoprolinase family protein [Anaerolineae bacterium]
MPYLLSFDIGGTFTDFSLLNTHTGQLRTHKRLTTPKDPAQGVMDGVRSLLAQANVHMREIDTVYHATTLVANTLIERNGATVALLCTAGHRDVLEIRTEQRYDVYDLFLQYPPPLVPRYLRFSVNERTDRDGNILLAPSQSEIVALAEQLRQAKVDAVAIAFLHSYRNPTNERQVAAWLAEAWGVESSELRVESKTVINLQPSPPHSQLSTLNSQLSISSEVAPEIREYERTSTTVANAYVQPKVQGYLRRLEAALKAEGYGGRVYLTLSSGGNASAKTAARYPIRLVESGPAAGAMAAAYFGASAGKRDLVAFDMGGTTAKICVIDNGRPELARELEVARLHRFKKGSGIPLQFPSIDMIEIGAGGGSIAKYDQLGLLKIGPESAASDPGPACYGLGGTQPTVTDANLLLGYLNPAYFSGGQMALHPDLAQIAMMSMANHSPLTPNHLTTLAYGVHQLANENMALAAKIHIIEKGRDPRHYALLAYGGGGPLHGAGVAKILGANEIICPLGAGVGSAIGLLIAPMSFELAQSYPVKWDAVKLDELNAVLATLEAQGRAQLAEAGVIGDVRVERSADGRFVGQLHQLSIRLPTGDLTPDQQAAIQAEFLARYHEQYEHLPKNAAGGHAPIEFISWQVTVRGPQPQVQFARLQAAGDGAAALKGHRPAYFGDHGWHHTPVYDRYALTAGAHLTGPAIVEERESTALVHPGMSARLDGPVTLVLHIS